MIQKSFLVLLVSLLSAANLILHGQENKVLIYTRNGEGYVHDNIDASVDALKKICIQLGISYEVSDDPAIFNDQFDRRFDAVIFSNTNNEAFLDEQQKIVFKSFIQNGGGFVGIHSACGSERQWPWFWAMVGGKFVRHPPYQPFVIQVIDRNHPATDFLKDEFEWTDECYYMNYLNPDIHVLLAADLTTLEDPEIEIYPGNTFGDLFPLAWFHEFDGGREFFTALGHDEKHYEDNDFIRHLTGGLEWVLQLK